MRIKMCVFVLAFAGFGPWARPGLAQDSSARVKAIQARLAELRKNFEKLPFSVQATMSEQRRLLGLEQLAGRVAVKGSVFVPTFPSSSDHASTSESPATVNGVVSVNDPRRDLAFSRFGGYSNTTSSTARCGNQVVVGYNRSASLLETFIAATGGISFSGVAVSSDGGERFRDLGFTPPGPNATDFAFGEPTVTCADASRFYYVQMYSTIGFNNQSPTSIALSASNDGGDTWSDPAPVVNKSQSHILDSPWSAIDPSNHKRIYVSYRDIDFSGTNSNCLPGDLRTAIEVVASKNGGKTFDAPIVAAEQCFSNLFEIVLASRVAVDSHGRVYVAWQDTQASPVISQDIAISSFVPGKTPSAPVIIDQVVQGGAEAFHTLNISDEFILQGGFQNYRGIDLAVDHSRGAHDGEVYVVWNDARNKSAPDEFDLFAGLYFFDDVMFSRSADGVAFSPTTQVNGDAQPKIGRGFDHFQPAIAVDRTGKVAVCWKDRRKDPENYRFERFCAGSTDTGSTWVESRIGGTLSSPSRGQDRVINPDTIGNYDALASDFLRQSDGFTGAFQVTTSGMHPDIKAHHFN